MNVVKILLAFVMLGIVAILSFLFGIAGFVVALGMSIVISMMLSRMEREKLEKQRHEELLEASRSNRQAD
ncbi:MULTISPECIES: hypothetical protein [unclassified Vibrio]|uniref:hypothetical protein n=1 Tax=unclassified Vibrio TaxID=2614977 RepID=UPI002963E577|nr:MULTISPECIES: hypothetical protein [unclassified Vibrio]MDW1674142.1 hypothetical protein [Vibrio sp. Vb2610]MDW1805986.1 hypothetical protein [Vibrio sp. Vb2628]